MRAKPSTAAPHMIRRLADNEPLPSGEPRRYKRADGYVVLRWKVGTQSYVEAFEHRVVAGRPAGQHVHHVNENKADNDPSNLRALAPTEHIQHHQPLTWDVDLAMCMYMEGWTLPQIAEHFDKNTGNVSRMLRSRGVDMRTTAESRALIKVSGVRPQW